MSDQESRVTETVSGELTTISVVVPTQSLGPVTYKGENFVLGAGISYDWLPAWLRAIALAWSDTQLKQALVERPQEFLKTYCNYTIPDTVEIVVREDTASQFTTDPNNHDSYQWVMSKNVLILNLPQKPESESQAAVALAAYEAVGLSYPFTCTCS